MDVLVVGGGPAGRALARACAREGLATGLVDRDPAAPWRATYAAWADEVGDAAVLTRSRAVAFAVREHRPGREYVVLDQEPLRALDGVRVFAGRVTSRSPTHARLADGRVLRARRVVHAGGGRGTAHQTAVGVVVSQAEAAPFVAPGEAVVMDWRRPPDAGTSDPTFLYAVPVGPDRVLLEETSLAHAPGLPSPELRRRLHARLAAHGVPVPVAEERVRIALDVVPDRDAFGAAAGFVNPTTGYGVARALALAPVAARALATGEPLARALWSPTAKGVHLLRTHGLSALLALRPADVPQFFDTFFRMADNQQRNYLSTHDDLRGVATAMTVLFRSSRWPVRHRLAFPRQTGKSRRTTG
ncbi:lycopene cyclase family protein [Actinosynnema sp. NPDC020468]|uniref:lycopene cyclase family protein n=1 Tax=Actinosynnema sp. NPDC020468 TaxID=3154488 RepID=UPI0033DA1596